MSAELYQIASYIVFIVISGVLGALAESTILGAFVNFKVLGVIEEVKILWALLEFKVWGVLVSDLGFKSFESC